MDQDAAPQVPLVFVENTRKNPLKLGRLVIDDRVRLDDTERKLKPQTRRIFNFIVQAGGAPIPADEFIRRELTYSTEALKVHISWIRAAFADVGMVIPHNHKGRGLRKLSYRVAPELFKSSEPAL